MGRHVRTSLALLLSAMTLGAAVACSVMPEEKIVKDFFRASRLRDNAALGTFATTSFDPNRQGQVTEFNVLSVSAEHSSPLSLKGVRHGLRRGDGLAQGLCEGKIRFPAGKPRRHPPHRKAGVQQRPRAEEGRCGAGNLVEMARR